MKRNAFAALRAAVAALLTGWCLLGPGGEARAAGPGELSKPYHLRIVLHVAKNRLLTDVFRDRVERELRDGFQAGLGELGKVEVVRDHPRLPDVLANGLLQSLNTWRDRSDVKTHFVLIDFSGVHYEIQARQYDGPTGRPSPVVRRDRTRDRDFVAKAVALLVLHDFGVVGTVVTPPEGPQQQQRVKLELRGGALGDLSRLVQKDDVFVLAPPGGGSPPELRWSLLQVQDPPREGARDGACVCRFFHRYQVSGIAGYRCLKVGTTQTALRLRWMQEGPRGLTPLEATTLTLEVRRHGFTGEDATKLPKTTDAAGGVDTRRDGDKGVFSHVAFVSVTGGLETKPQVPVALVDDQPVVIEVNATQKTANLLSFRKAAWEGNVSESLLVQINLFKELEALGARPDQRGEVLARARAGLERTRADYKRLMDERAELLREAGATPPSTAREDQRLKDLQEGERLLERFINEQKKIEAEENDPKRKAWRSEVQRAQLLEKDYEIDKAIAIYRQVKQEGYQDAALDRHLAELEKLWKPVDAKHEAAREFIYRVWPTLDTAGLKENLEKARQALTECQRARDFIAIRKLFKATEAHAIRLEKEARELNPRINVDDEQPARRIQEVSPGVVKLGGDIQAYLQQNQPAEK
jgi:hypothetical protein